MTDEMGRQLGNIGRRATRILGRSGSNTVLPTPSPPGAPLAGDDPIEHLAERLDIGASTQLAGPRYAWDADREQLAGLLESVTHHVAARNQRAWVQLPGRCLPLTADTTAQRLDDIGARPRLRILVTDGQQMLENIAIELWRRSPRAYRSLSDEHPVRLFVPDLPAASTHRIPTEQTFSDPVDAVLLWVDGADPAWRALASRHMDLEEIDADLYTSIDELKYAIRSLDVFAPWIRTIHVVSNCAPPRWFEPSDRVRWVDHAEVGDPDVLPLFSANAIETLLRYIPDLAEFFIYLNDDFALWDSATPSTFFDRDGRSVARLAANSSVLYLQQLVEAGSASASQQARVNAARVLEQRTGAFESRIHGHVPYAMRRSRLVELEDVFAAEFAAARAFRTQQPDDITVVPYLYPHYGHAQGWVRYEDAPSSFVTINNYRRPGIRRTLGSAPFVCFQDSHDSAGDEAYRDFKLATLEAALPIPSSAERA